MQRSQKQNVKNEGLKIKESVRIGIVVADFNPDITKVLLKGALGELRKSGVLSGNITVRHVPGSFEIPLACQKFAETGKFDALVALGCVIKGETDHYYYVAGEAARGIMEVMLKFSIPISFGVLTVNTLAQAKERAGKKMDAGGAAARAALRMLHKI